MLLAVAAVAKLFGSLSNKLGRNCVVVVVVVVDAADNCASAGAAAVVVVTSIVFEWILVGGVVAVDVAVAAARLRDARWPFSL